MHHQKELVMTFFISLIIYIGGFLSYIHAASSQLCLHVYDMAVMAHNVHKSARN